MNQHIFFNKIRHSVFGGKLSQGQVSGMQDIVAQWAKAGHTDSRWIAYILATAFHETARSMQPVEEWGKGAGRKYGEADKHTGKIYYGRGHVQLTWLRNYTYWSHRMGRDFVNHPEDVLIPEVSAYILVNGMIDGAFTGKKLVDYFSDTISDPVMARKIVNGLDKANLIASYYTKFLDAIN